jgi:hypothetical protein
MSIKTFIAGLMCLALVVSSCSLFQNGGFDICSAVSVAQSQQQAIETAASYIVAFHTAGTVTDIVYNKAGLAYGAWAASQVTLANALVMVNDNNGSAPTPQQIAQMTLQITLLAADFIAVYESITTMSKPVFGPNHELKSVNPTATPPCAMTDQQIQQDLAVPAWASLI